MLNLGNSLPTLARISKTTPYRDESETGKQALALPFQEDSNLSKRSAQIQDEEILILLNSRASICNFNAHGY